MQKPVTAALALCVGVTSNLNPWLDQPGETVVPEVMSICGQFVILTDCLNIRVLKNLSLKMVKLVGIKVSTEKGVMTFTLMYRSGQWSLRGNEIASTNCLKK